MLKILSRHPSHDVLRGAINCPQNAVVRFGSTTLSNKPVQINSSEACLCSSNKLMMKKAFDSAGCKTALWCKPDNEEELNNFIEEVPSKAYIVKSFYSSKGAGIYKFDDFQTMKEWFENRYGRYIVEKFYNYSKEYRLHVTKDGCFYTCRKMLKKDAEHKWHRHNNNSVWVIEENKLFEKPSNWDNIVSECINCLNAVGLDIGACDVIVQNQENPDFIICEINSAPSFGQITAIKYKEQLLKMVH